MRAQKGSRFEREISRQLSLWWTGGERDDVFWRSSQSGGRATQRAKQGKATYGAYGDITALDPIGEPLLKLFTLELKRGRSHGTLEDLLDLPKDSAIRPVEKTLLQAHDSHRQARSKFWMVISQRDRRAPMIWMPREALNALSSDCPLNLQPPISFSMVLVRRPEGGVFCMRISCLPLAFFLKRFSPQDVRRALRRNDSKVVEKTT